MKRFPSGVYGRQKLNFYPAPFRAPLRAFAALMFAWQEHEVLICNIEDRGWCVPSGRVEPHECSRDAVCRETLEEGGALLELVQYIGCYRVHERRDIRWVDCYASKVRQLVDITHQQESLGRQFVPLKALPAIYHLWTPLTEMVFLHSYEIVERLDRMR